MTISPANKEYVFVDSSHERPMRNDTYEITRFTELEAPEYAKLSWMIHAEGYENMGFVKPEAITEEGYLSSTIDKARGENVDYYIAINSDADENQLNAATVRKINLLPGGDVTDLPAYKLCGDSLYDDERNWLLGLDNADDRVKELGALSRTRAANPASVFELLRDSCQEVQGKDEVWFFSIVSTTYKALTDAFGSTAIRQIGTPISLDDDRVEDKVSLVPVVAEIDTFIGEIYDSAQREEYPQAQRRLIRSFLFFCEGLTDEQLGDRLAQARAKLLGQATS